MDKNILKNDEAMTILRDAATQLQAIGVHCMISPMSLPQGMSISLHAGGTEEAATAADMAAERGGEYAHAVGTSKQFAQMVVCAIADNAVDYRDVHVDTLTATSDYSRIVDQPIYKFDLAVSLSLPNSEAM